MKHTGTTGLAISNTAALEKRAAKAGVSYAQRLAKQVANMDTVW